MISKDIEFKQKHNEIDDLVGDGDLANLSISELRDERDRAQSELKEYRLLNSKLKERHDHLERMNKEHESLYV